MQRIIAEYKSENFDKLMKVYDKDPFKARVLFLNDALKVSQMRMMLFEDGQDFSFVVYEKKFGISITNRRYSRDSIIASVVYKAGKFYIINKGIIKQLTYSSLRFFGNTIMYNRGYSDNIASEILAYFTQRFSWVRFISENNVLHGRSFNTFVNKKLYNYNDAVRYFFKVPLPVVKEIIAGLNGYGIEDSVGGMIKRWVELRKVLINVENLTANKFKFEEWNDLCRMARTLNKKINCGWSLKRLKQEHDKWSGEISDILLECEDLRQLMVRDVYLKFAKFSGYEVLVTNKQIMAEGMTKRHCVATYVSQVDSGKCGIYRVHGHTMELKVKDDGLYLCQIKGYKNAYAPSEITAEVSGKLADFNRMVIETSGKFTSFRDQLFGMGLEEDGYDSSFNVTSLS